MPYISASIIMQLMSIVSPQLEALKKEGDTVIDESILGLIPESQRKDYPLG
jgi:preprotein translocase subunit SecY